MLKKNSLKFNGISSIIIGIAIKLARVLSAGFFVAASVCLAEPSFAAVAPGVPFSHLYTITNSSTCNITITKIYKQWQSINGAITKVEYRPPGGPSLTDQNYTVTYTVNLYMPAGATATTALTFYTDPNVSADTITSRIWWDYTPAVTGCTINNSAQGQTSIITPASGGVCGNGVTEANESCDDSNTISGDGCSAICQSESKSGN